MAEATPGLCPLCGTRPRPRPAFRAGRWSVRVCPDCDHGWTEPRPGREELEALYEAEEYYEERSMFDLSVGPGFRKRFRGIARDLSGRRFLDVGCGTGALAAAAREAGFEVVATELSRSAAEAAREGHGLEVRVGPFRREQFRPGERFDVVTMIHVLEHLPEPVEALVLARELLADDGLLYVEVPNRRAFGARFPGPERRKVLDLPHHLHHFTPTSLRRAFRETGFETLSVRASLPEILDDALGLAARLKRRLLPGGDGTVEGPEEPAAPGREGGGARLVALIRRWFPGYKLVARARRKREE